MNFDKLVHGLKEKTETGIEKLKDTTGLDNLEEPLPEDKLGEHIIVTYQRLRQGMGFIALFFPLLIVAYGSVYGIDLEKSYSAYYFGLPAGDLKAGIFPGIFPTRVLFCGLLFALGVFLILYKGFNTAENILLWVAGVAAICVAVFPMWYDEMYPYSGFPYEDWFRVFSVIHYGAAIVLFGCMALVAWFCSKTTLNDKRLIAELERRDKTGADRHPVRAAAFIAYLPVVTIPALYVTKSLPTQRDTFWRIYNWIGTAMLLFLPIAWVATNLTQWSAYLVLFAEALGVWTFAAFWLLKSHELKLSQPEVKAIKGMNPLPGGSKYPIRKNSEPEMTEERLPPSTEVVSAHMR